ncbi:MAG: hypothetical protein IJ555_11385 [Ruminococcus sp.]|nr:hypothetical protein [Ruminococcus sp.]
MKRLFFELWAVFFIGSIAYGSIEVIERGYSHISMALLGGVSMVVIHFLNDERREGASVVILLTISTLFITACELLAGEILNVYLELHIWNYNGMAYNFDGVICLSYTGYWFLLSIAGMIVDEAMRVKMFCEKPVYPSHLFKKRAYSP